MFANQDWKKITTKAAIGMPGIAFAVFFVLNLLVWEQRRYVFGLSQICQHTVLPLTLVTVQTDYGDCCPYIVQYTPNTGLTLSFVRCKRGRRAVRHVASDLRAVVFGVHAVDVFRELLWAQKNTSGATRAHEQNTATSTAAEMVFEQLFHRPRGRRPAFRRRVHRAVFHFELNVAPPGTYFSFISTTFRLPDYSPSLTTLIKKEVYYIHHKCTVCGIHVTNITPD